MLGINGHMQRERGAESDAVWLERQRKRQEKQARRRREAARFDRRHRMVLGNVGPEDDAEYRDSIPGV